MTKKAKQAAQASIEPASLFIRIFEVPYWLTPELSSIGACRTYTVNDEDRIEREDDDLRVTIELNDGSHIILPPHSVITYEQDHMRVEYPFVTT